MNLNTVSPETHQATAPHRAKVVHSSEVTVYFDDLEAQLISLIRQSQKVVGCVAWLTNFNILDALAHVPEVNILVQKEDFLRPDIGSNSEWKLDLRQKYNSLKPGDRPCFVQGAYLSVCGGYDVPNAVRAVGNYNRDKSPAMPRMHHKFMVFFKEPGSHSVDNYSAFAVWTGSFNFTQNATYSFENAVVMTNPSIIKGYLDEYDWVFSLSEPLDWESDWVVPEFRIGT